MAANVIDGKQVASSVIDRIKTLVSELEKSHGVKPGLAVVIVGADPASHAYVSSKSKMAKECGFLSIQHTLPEATSQEDLASLVESLNADPAIQGILVQLPLPIWIPNPSSSRSCPRRTLTDSMSSTLDASPPETSPTRSSPARRPEP